MTAQDILWAAFSVTAFAAVFFGALAIVYREKYLVLRAELRTRGARHGKPSHHPGLDRDFYVITREGWTP